jgi:hypothetical protein
MRLTLRVIGPGGRGMADSLGYRNGSLSPGIATQNTTLRQRHHSDPQE